MDSGTVIVGLVLVAICVLPIVILNGRRAKKGRGMLQLITKVANEHNCNISEHEFCSEYCIGMDKTNGFVFFAKEKDGTSEVRHIDLAPVKTCKINNTGRIVTYKNQNNKIIERLSLDFYPKEKDKGVVTWEFYNVEENLQLNGELQSVEKWQQTINNYLKG
ncbi:hypothetical protein [Maribellus sp. YY47]|uniref:hypothetical protein n=1 Tax=Maribellus sp. YY47 TaxID=2929486 RepID=UPI0020011C87|nr:hypothetical protein [Maribellus sp. YY47]MCK3683445.1 hypothetical protein [Maribellus sp. YY47]